MEIKSGDHVEVINAHGERTVRIALTGVIRGRDFPVVRVAGEAEVAAARTEGRDPEGVPWPAEDVHPVVGV